MVPTAMVAGNTAIFWKNWEEFVQEEDDEGEVDKGEPKRTFDCWESDFEEWWKDIASSSQVDEKGDEQYLQDQQDDGWTIAMSKKSRRKMRRKRKSRKRKRKKKSKKRRTRKS